MKLCPECHKLSKDDDFCSRCGAAVYNTENYSGDNLIDCSRQPDHSHEKTTYTKPYSTLENSGGVRRYSGVDSAGRPYTGRDFTQSRSNPAPKKKKGGIGRIIMFVIMLSILESMGMLDVIIQALEDIFG